MLTILTGRSASGKTRRMLDEIKLASESGGRGIILLVPEQQSHDYERLLCESCGAKVNLCAEVLSFTRLAGRVETERGGIADRVLDKGGRVLLMSLALRSVRSLLKVYSSASEKPDFIVRLLESADELKSCRISPEKLTNASAELCGAIADKAYDIGLICMTYDALCANVAMDPRDRLTRLADNIGESRLSRGTLYIDGFTDFTAQELAVIEGFISAGADVTVALTCCRSESEDASGAFSVQLAAKKRLLQLAEKHKTQMRELYLEGAAKKADALLYLERNLFAEQPEGPVDAGGAIELFCASSLACECETAAAKVLELVRAGYRYRDIAVASRGFASIAQVAESIFSYYGVPVFLSRMEDILQKPVMSLLVSALDCVSGIWDYDSVFRYLRTDLAGISMEECDTLESYALTWDLKGGAWTADKDWTRNPAGYKSELTEEEAEKLKTINALRRRAIAPLLKLRDSGRKAATATEQARALYAFMEDISLAQSLESRARRLADAGEMQRADEYRQLWDIIVGALEQTAAILGEQPMEQQEFAQLLRIVLSQYDVGSIPASLDCVTLGDLSRLKSGAVKCLLVINADSGRLPAVTDGRGMFSDTERIELEGIGVELSGSAEDRLGRELGDIYTALTAATDKLILSYNGGADVSPSFVLSKTAELFALEFMPENDGRRTAAVEPCFALASSLSDSREAAAAREYIAETIRGRERLEAVRRAATFLRGELSRSAAKALYGENLTLSASKADKFMRCRFSYFMRFGLRAKARRQAGLDAPQTGLFVHYVLEKTTEQLKALGGFRGAKDDEIEKTACANIQAYLRETLGGIDDKDGRFRYLFSRLSESTLRIIRDMSGELKASLFSPVGFEMDFSDEQSGDAEGFTLTGAVDRVDGYIKDGRLYLRVVDYKTGRKSFELSDIWYGLGMQTLIYLFELQKNGKRLYGREIVPAGVLYAPARDIILNVRRDTSDEKIAEAMAKELVRSGLLMDDSEIIRAMETGDAPKYLPVKLKDGEASGSSLASLERFGQLSKHIDKTLAKISAEIKSGSIAAEPYFETKDKGECDWCDYRAACLFSDGGGEDKKRFLRRVPSEEAWQKIAEEVQYDGRG